MISNKPIFDDQCDDGPLLQMLRSDCDSHDSDEMLDHVETCERCQHRLDELAADESDWQTTVEVLSNTARDANTNGPGAFDLSLDLPRIHARQQAWTESMARQLLSPASHPEMLGRIGRYDVERLIGSGGMGVVFKAYDTELNRPLAVKLLAPYLASSGASRNRFAREARAAAAVVDDHVVPIHNVETDDEHPFLVMKYIAGGSLQQRLDREGPLDVCEVLRIGMQSARGLAAAHAQGLIHRDVKPSNILLDEGVERALLTDFGLARATDDASLTRSGFHPGTPHYMSPEQVRGEEIDARSDLFGLGCVLYALCTGHPPFRSESTYAVLRRITDDTPRPIREMNADIPEWLEGIVMKLLAKSADDRFESAEQVAEILEDCLAHVQQPTTTTLPKSVSALAAQRSGRPPISKFIAAAAFAFSVIFLGVLIVIELNKGTLTIESDADDVPIRIMLGNEHVESLMVSKLGTSIRVSAGNYVIEIDGDFPQIRIDKASVSLSRRGQETVRIQRTETVPVAATDLDPNLIGSWRIMNPGGDEPQWDFGENIVLTFENWTMTWLNESESPDRFVYQLLPDNMIRFVPVSESSSDNAPTEHRYRYKLRDANQLELEVGDSSGYSSGILLLKRLQKSDQASTYASQLVPVDISKDYGWPEKEVLETHVRLIQSNSFFASVDWPDEIDMLSATHDQFLTNLRMRLIVEPTEQSQIEIGLHGDVKTKPLREQIVKSIADAYRKKIAETQMAAAQKVIELLLKSHAETHKDREVAEAKHRRLAQSHDTNPKELAESLARLKRLNELLTKLSDHLLEYGVPAIAGSLEFSLRRIGHVEIAESKVNDSSSWETHKVFHPAHIQEVRSVKFSPDGKTIASAASDKTVKLWDAVTGELRRTITRPVNCIGISFSPDGSLLAIAGGDFGSDPAGEIVICDLRPNGIDSEEYRVFFRRHDPGVSECRQDDPNLERR